MSLNHSTTIVTWMYTGIEEPRPGESRRDRVYRILKHRLLMGEVPLKERLAEEHLAAELDVSRTPVREAILRLYAEGLAEPHDDGGFRPTVPDMAGIRELYEVRLALELAAIRRPGESGGRHHQAQLDVLEEHWMALTLRPPAPDPIFVLEDESFHVSLAAAAGNRALTETLRSVNERIRAVRMHDFLTEDRILATIDQHLDIVRALRVDTVAVAIARLTVHLTDSIAVVEARAEAAISRMKQFQAEESEPSRP
jgi:DNA-binding GntR family transcriptional regulator